MMDVVGFDPQPYKAVIKPPWVYICIFERERGGKKNLWVGMNEGFFTFIVFASSYGNMERVD